MGSTNEKILVPIGFTNQSILALKQAVIVAKHTNSRALLLTKKRTIDFHTSSIYHWTKDEVMVVEMMKAFIMRVTY